MSVETRVEQGLPRIVEKNPVYFLDTPGWAIELQRTGKLPTEYVFPDPVSYCAGVERSNDAGEKMLDEFDSVYFYHAPIHNETKLKEIESRGGILVNNVEDIPFRAPVVLSAHGVSPKVWEHLRWNQNKGIDATCPLVDKTHREAIKLSTNGYKIIVIGEEKHDEIQGLIGEAPSHIKVISPKCTTGDLDELLDNLSDENNIAVRNQTTLAYYDVMDMIEYIKSKRPDVNEARISDVCYATQNRQEAVIAAIEKANVDFMLIFGSDESKRTPSGNTIRQREVSISHGVRSKIVEDIFEIDSTWFDNVKSLGVGAGASADPKRLGEFFTVLKNLGVRNDQIKRITIAQELQEFAPARRFDFSSN